MRVSLIAYPISFPKSCIHLIFEYLSEYASSHFVKWANFAHIYDDTRVSDPTSVCTVIGISMIAAKRFATNAFTPILGHMSARNAGKPSPTQLFSRTTAWCTRAKRTLSKFLYCILILASANLKIFYFSCSICSKSFTLLHQLKAHLQTLTHKSKEEYAFNSTSSYN